MKMLVYSETIVKGKGGKPLNIKLKQPFKLKKFYREEAVFVVFRESSKEVNFVALENKADVKNAEFLLDNKKQLVFKTTATDKFGKKKHQVEVKGITKPFEIEDSWDVEFLKQNEYEAKVTFDKLTDWKDHSNENIKYYSGTAIYRKTFNFETKKRDESERYLLDLGKVNIAAEVILNGKNLGVLWMAPFRVDITKELQQGTNTLEIRVTNQWTNHLIGDERFAATDGYNKEATIMPTWYTNNEPMPESKRTTFTAAAFYTAKSPLLPAGLVGPVVIKNEKIVLLKK